MCKFLPSCMHGPISIKLEGNPRVCKHSGITSNLIGLTWNSSLAIKLRQQGIKVRAINFKWDIFQFNKWAKSKRILLVVTVDLALFLHNQF